MDAAIWRRLEGLLGLGIRGRMTVVGVEQVRSAAHRGTLAFAVVAQDASRHSRTKVVPLLTAKGIAYVEAPSGAALGAAVGRETAAAVGVVDWQLARGMRAAVDGAERKGHRGRVV